MSAGAAGGAELFVVPVAWLPPGFAERVAERPPAEPAVPWPAATVVLLRDAPGGPEALLVRRPPGVGFVPGAYVFPGGRVDDADRDPRLLEWLAGVGPGAEDVAARVAAIRELFEEVGVLLARDAAGRPAAPGAAAIDAWREVLRSGRGALLDVAVGLGARLDAGALVACAHWITPATEPRRYDTRFYLAALPEGAEARPAPGELAEALWIPPAAALERFRAAQFPMVFPTVKVLESLAGFGSVAESLAAFRGRRIPTILPRLVRVEGGLGVVIEEAVSAS